MNTITAVGTPVGILSTNGTGRRTATGHVVGIQRGGIYLVRKANGKTLAVNASLVVPA